jgi:DNA polymerase (family 10)
MDNRLLTLLAHPTGRLINARAAYALDIDRIMRGAAERGCYLELNAQPDRLDLSDAHCRLAKQIGVKVAISTDAHATHELDFMCFGVGQARRGWLEAEDVLNKRAWDVLHGLLHRRGH